jgi:glyoxylase-like metal-dependent hydrolase (beta-lactamase superfamily II)
MDIDRSTAFSRRHFLASATVAAAAAVSLAPRRAFAKEDGVVESFRKSGATAKITVEKLRGNVHVLIGSGGNIAVLSGPDGKLLVDAGLAGSRPQITEALAGIGKEPIKHVVNTHWHFDHTDGNEWLHDAGATVVAHANTKKRLSEPTRVADWDFTFEPSPAGALPTVVVKDKHAIELNGTTVEIAYYRPCHTDTDLSVRFAVPDVMHLGDTWWNGHYPFIDYSTGGSINEMIRATNDNLKAAVAKTILIPGHGPVGDRAQLTEYRDMLAEIRDAVEKLKKQGKSIDEVIAAKPTAKYDEKYGDFVIDGPHFTRLCYAGV